jgi:uncharacterized protein DUF4288
MGDGGTMDWYSFCGLFKWEIIDATGDVRPDGALVEERIVLFYAASFDEAIRLGEAEAEAYTRDTWPNANGDTVRTRYLGVCNVFAMKASPAEGVEAYSRLLLRPSTEADDVVIERLLGSESEQETCADAFEPDFDRVVERNRKETKG